MDFVNQAYAQLAELFRSLSVGTRIATGLLLALVVVSLVYLFQYQVTGGDEFLLGGRPFSASELTAIEAAFAKAGLGKSQIVGTQIRIPRGKKDVYLAALADGNALPADFSKYLDEAAAADNPWASTKSLEMRRWNAKQKSLALIISKMHGIESATVQYDEEVKRGLISQKQKTAMVAIQTSGGQLEEGQVKAIRNVIASSYAGLERQHITITDMTSGFSYGGAIGPDGTPEDESLYAAHKQRFEREWQRKLREHFSYIKGILVAINVELNPEVEQSTQTVKIDSKPVTVVTHEFSKESTSHSPTVAGRPGAASNGVVGNTAVNLQQTAGGGPESQTTESGSDIKNIPGYEQMSKKTVSLTPKKVTASIDVPASYYEQIWTKRNPPTTGKQAKPPDAAEIARIEAETKKRIEETVRNLLPDLPKGETPYPHIVVSTYTDLPSSPAAPPSLVATTGTWLGDNWQTLALVGVGLMSLLMLRSMVRSLATAPTTAAATGEAAPPRLAVHETTEEEEDPEPAKALRSRFRSSGPDLKAELHEIVKENPDAAATILKAWIGEAA